MRREASCRLPHQRRVGALPCTTYGDTLLRTGVCFTVEPSIMLPNSWSVRVEDVVMVTEKGGVPFSNYHKS